MRYHISPIRLQKSKSVTIHCWRGCENTLLYSARGNAQWNNFYSPYLVKGHMHLPFDPAMPLLGLSGNDTPPTFPKYTYKVIHYIMISIVKYSKSRSLSIGYTAHTNNGVLCTCKKKKRTKISVNWYQAISKKYG